ncbi:MAG: DNA adenine methylase, partial [Thermoplasmata archaeon]
MLRIMRYPGSKARLIPAIKELYLKSGADTFIDVFGGSGTVLLNIVSEIKIYNDIDKDLFNFFNTVRCSSYDLINNLKTISRSDIIF